MVLLISIESIRAWEINNILEKFAQDFRSQIDKIYCIGNEDIISQSHSNTKILNKPVLYLSNSDNVISMLRYTLLFEKVIVSVRNVDQYIFRILFYLKDFEIYTGYNKGTQPKFINNKELFLAICENLAEQNFNRGKMVRVGAEIDRISKERKIEFQKMSPNALLEKELLNENQFQIVRVDYSSKAFLYVGSSLLFYQLPAMKLLKSSKRLIKENILVGGRIIELWIGIEYLSDEELTALVYLIRNNPNKLISYRLISHGSIPRILLNLDLPVLRLSPKMLYPEISKQSDSMIFYTFLLDFLKKISRNIQIVDITASIEKDLFSPLISFLEPRIFRTAILKTLRSLRKPKFRPLDPSDNYFWYKLFSFYIETAIQFNSITISTKNASDNLYKLVKLKIEDGRKDLPPPKTKIKKIKESNFPDKLEFEIQTRLDEKKKVEVKEWMISYNKAYVDTVKYEKVFIHIIKVLNDNYEKSVSIDAEELEKIIDERLPSKKEFRENKNPSLYDENKKLKKNSYLNNEQRILNRYRNARSAFFDEYNSISGLRKHFIFEKGECAFKPMQKLTIIFS